MKLKTLLTLLTTVVIGCTAAIAEDDTQLAKEMKVINKNLRTLKRQIEDTSKKDENLALLADIKKATEASTNLEPAKAKGVPAGDKAAYIEKYKKQMADLGKTFADLETAIKDGKADEAKKAFEKLSEQKEMGHKDFTDE